MDRSQTRMLVVLAGLLLAVCGVLYWQGEQEVDFDPEATAEVWSVDAEQVTRVVVHREAGDLALVREGDQWKVEQPFDALADQARVDELVRSLAQLKHGIPVDAPADRAGEFGLGDPPAARVEVSLADGSTQTLDVGSTAAVGYRTYVRAKDGSIAAATGDPSRLLQADAERFRDTRIFRFDPGKVRSVSVASPEGTLAVRGQQRTWTLEGFLRADPDKVDDWVTGLQGLRFDHQSEGTVVDAPRFTVRVGVEGQPETVLVVGEETPMGVVASVSDGRSGVVFPETLAELGRGPTDVGQRVAFLVDPERTDHVRFEGLGKVFEATRNGSAWESPTVDGDAALDRARQLAGIPVEYRREPPPHFETPEVVVTVENPDDPPIVWELGPAQPDGTRTLREKGSPEPGLRVPDAALAGFVGELP